MTTSNFKSLNFASGYTGSNSVKPAFSILQLLTLSTYLPVTSKSIKSLVQSYGFIGLDDYSCKQI